MKRKTINEMMYTGIWLITLDDKSKWVVDMNKKLYDSYEWYKAVGTLENEYTDINVLLKDAIYGKKIGE